jgi:SAM-dependent methyltransferase
MTDWTSGYVADIGYTYGYYAELNPARVKLAFLNAGLACPEMGTACELGFGQGVSANFHAAASLTSWHGTDFNPSQAGFAQELARVSGSGAQLFDEAFDAFCARDLPDFDYIGLHGIWSWISDANRAVIVDFVRRKLKVGGVLYISYNTLPGWGAFAPMRHLMTQHAEVVGADGAGIVSRINGAIDFTEKLLAVNPAYARANPQIKERMEKLKGHNRHYLAHEYFNADWEPMHFSQMADWLSSAKLQYACSANLIDSVEPLNLTKEQAEFLNEITDVTFRETTRDFIVNQQFRKDYWVKGARNINPISKSLGLKSIRLLLTSRPEAIALKVNTLAGEDTLNEPVYKPVIDLMADHKVRNMAQMEETLTKQGLTLAQIVQAVVVLYAQGHLNTAQEEAVVNKRLKSTQALNTHLMELARSSGDISFLVSPVTGGGITVSRFNQIFLLARQSGNKTAQQWAQFACGWLKAQGQLLLKEGQPLKTEEENIAELTRQASEFEQKDLPILKALQIA